MWLQLIKKMQIKNKISLYGKHLPKAGLTSLLLNKGAATHFITYESHFVGSAAITQIVKWSSIAVAGLGTYDAVSGATQITQIAPSGFKIRLAADNQASVKWS